MSYWLVEGKNANIRGKRRKMGKKWKIFTVSREKYKFGKMGRAKIPYFGKIYTPLCKYSRLFFSSSVSV